MSDYHLRDLTEKDRETVLNLRAVIKDRGKRRKKTKSLLEEMEVKEEQKQEEALRSHLKYVFDVLWRKK
jgi:hypothetical protein